MPPTLGISASPADARRLVHALLAAYGGSSNLSAVIPPGDPKIK
jgi:hypothetical protein